MLIGAVILLLVGVVTALLGFTIVAALALFTFLMLMALALFATRAV